MAEKFEVGYTRIPGVGEFDVYHKYILYTNNAGERFYARGGPVFMADGLPDVSDLKLKTESGRYRQGTPDWDKSVNDPSAEPHPRETVTTGDDLSEKWESIKNTIDAANNSPKNLPSPLGDANHNGIPDILESPIDPAPKPLPTPPKPHSHRVATPSCSTLTVTDLVLLASPAPTPSYLTTTQTALKQAQSG